MTARHPRGTSAGGRFAPGARAEPAVALPSPGEMTEAEIQEAIADARAEEEAALAELRYEETIERRPVRRGSP